MENLSQTFKKDQRLQSILTAPTLSGDDKKQIVAEIQKSINVQDKTNTIENFLATLAENNRLSVLEGVAEKFGQLMGAARGEVELTITSASPLDNKTVKQLETAISKSKYAGQGSKLKVVSKVCEVDCVGLGGPLTLCRSTQTSREVSLSRLASRLLT